MDPNMTLIIGLCSGLALLNIVVFSLWYLWERKKRRITNDIERDKLTSLSHRPRKLVKRNRPSPPPPTHTLPEKYDTHSNSEPIRNGEQMYLPSPYDFPQPPKDRIVRPLGLSPLRNELYHAPCIQRRASESGDTASVYSTMSAPIHLHEEMLSETHSSFLTVDTPNTLNLVVNKYDPNTHGEKLSLAVDNGSYSIMQDLRPETYGPSYSATHCYNFLGISPNHTRPVEQRAASSEMERQICSVLPFHTTQPSSESKSRSALPERFSPTLEDFPSWLRSPYSP